MTEPGYLAATRTSYDTVAESYAGVIGSLFGGFPVGRGMLAVFAELVLAGGGGLVADVGCGPGLVTAHLNSLGVSAFGVDLSPKMIDIARSTYPELRFEVGSMTALDVPDGELRGLVAWWSIFHVPREEVPAVIAGFHRALAPGGHLQIGFHVGAGRLSPEKAYGGHPVSYTVDLHRPEDLADLLTEVGFDVTARLTTEGAKRQQAMLLARKRVD
ncbi:class I SAM-dependent methyltransferase [Umezawaea sp. Da 62-37]|uniref:class I SAM-dependent DNA methyltransferase n=1 Tax=Umezawaea sp. Da 62-37 TaxID=3075927 RepID=UPI0028F6EF67|nr:class I SAM-dependent methyltransferase [Umezawaea sp. Da 62-37]WNV89332.1 class I SAM-dependent methyltransferase [Umezawaea sp. Da 62-37]